MEISNTLIDKLAKLSRLHFDEEGKTAIRNDLEKMIGFVDKLNELDTSGVEPLMHINSNVNVLREDEVKQVFTRQQALMNASAKDEQFFKVPKVIKK